MAQIVLKLFIEYVPNTELGSGNTKKVTLNRGITKLVLLFTFLVSMGAFVKMLWKKEEEEEEGKEEGQGKEEDKGKGERKGKEKRKRRRKEKKSKRKNVHS